MKKRLMICLWGLVIAAAVTQAGLWDPPVVDPSFESVENGADHSTLGGWGYTFDEWFENPDTTAVFWEKGSAIGLESDGDMWLGCETGGTVYQAIGTVGDGATYSLTALLGSRVSHGGFVTGSFSIYAGGVETDGADGVALDSFATLLDSVEVTTADGTLVSTDVYEVEVELSSGTGYAGQTLWLQVKSVEGKDYFDNVQIVSALSAYVPDPANDAIDVPIDKVLGWNTAPDPNDSTQVNPLVTKHLVYLSSGNPADPNLVLVATIDAGSPPAATAQYDPPADLTRDGEYFWRIDEGIVADPNPDDPNDVIIGNVWTFKTVTSQPMLDADLPADVFAEAGENVAFTVSATNPFTMDDTGMTYAWYKVGESSVLSTATTLDIANVQIADEAQYSCTVTLTSNGATSDSRVAWLTVKRLTGHWPFDDDLVDVVAGNDGDYTSTGQPKFATGIIGTAFDMLTSGNPVTVPTVAQVTPSWTIAWWENSDPDTGGGWESMVGCGADADGWGVFEFGREASYRYAFGYNIGGGYIWSPNDSTLYPRGLWHLHTMAFDAGTQTATWSIDGAKYTDFTGVGYESFDTVFYIGNVRGLSQPYSGVIDDLRLYNYPLDAVEAATLYYNATGTPVCLEYPEFDLTDDCQVNIEDLSAFILDWMKCNIYPTCIN